MQYLSWLQSIQVETPLELFLPPFAFFLLLTQTIHCGGLVETMKSELISLRPAVLEDIMERGEVGGIEHWQFQVPLKSGLPTVYGEVVIGFLVVLIIQC
ncbi:unnamed protein product [Citrullus colocynthis]|uniref:Uncharacterized protein n=1 Tax=Citrullus colocynthis TaxID=252529 RepID=A0ABP0YXY3_9ROSI